VLWPERGVNLQARAFPRAAFHGRPGNIEHYGYGWKIVRRTDKSPVEV
jgi:hypothetical protein